MDCMSSLAGQTLLALLPEAHSPPIPLGGVEESICEMSRIVHRYKDSELPLPVPLLQTTMMLRWMRLRCSSVMRPRLDNRPRELIPLPPLH
jgi:hypothetical protein